MKTINLLVSLYGFFKARLALPRMKSRWIGAMCVALFFVVIGTAIYIPTAQFMRTNDIGADLPGNSADYYDCASFSISGDAAVLAWINHFDTDYVTPEEWAVIFGGGTGTPSDPYIFQYMHFQLGMTLPPHSSVPDEFSTSHPNVGIGISDSNIAIIFRHCIVGTMHAGVLLDSAPNIRIYNCEISANTHGMYIYETSNAVYSDLTITVGTAAGRGISTVDCNNLSFNNISIASLGFGVVDLDSVNLYYNNIAATSIYAALKCTSTSGLHFTNGWLTSSNIDESAIVGSNIFNVRIASSSIQGHSNEVNIKGGSNITLHQNIFTHGGVSGLNLVFVESVQGLVLSNNIDGVFLLQDLSAPTVVYRNLIRSSPLYGITVIGCNNILIQENIIQDPIGNGIVMQYSHYADVIGNNITDADIGMMLENSHHPSIRYNNITTSDQQGVWYACTYGELFNNQFIENGYEGLFCTVASSNTIIYDNTFVDNYDSMPYTQARDNGGSNSWNNVTHGNYWDDFRVRYPAASFNGNYWLGSYTILGSAYSIDHHPPIYNYAFKMNHPNDIIYEYAPLNQIGYTPQTLAWHIDRKATVDIHWELHVVSTFYTTIANPIDWGSLDDSPYTDLDSFDISFSLDAYFPPEIALGNHTFTLILSYDTESVVVEDEVVVYVQNIPPRVANNNPLMFPPETSSQIATFVFTDYSKSAMAYYSLYDDNLIIPGYSQRTWESGTVVSYDVSGLILGEHIIKCVVTDGLGGITTSEITVTVTNDFNNIDPVIMPINDITYAVGSINNLLTFTVMDTRTASRPVYEIIFDGDDESTIRGLWASNSPVSAIIDGLALGTHTCTVVARDGLLKQNKQEGVGSFTLRIVVYEGQNPPPIVAYTENRTINRAIFAGGVITLSWEVEDAVVNMPVYDLFMGDKFLEAGSWVSGVPIVYSVDTSGLSDGNYIFKLTVYDGYAKSTTTTITLTITSEFTTPWIVGIVCVVIAISLVGIFVILRRATRKTCPILPTWEASRLCRMTQPLWKTQKNR